jgi:hypothetical protein
MALKLKRMFYAAGFSNTEGRFFHCNTLTLTHSARINLEVRGKIMQRKEMFSSQYQLQPLQIECRIVRPNRGLGSTS